MEVSALNAQSMPACAARRPLLRLQSDERLVALTRRGQHAAFEALVLALPVAPAGLLPAHARLARGRRGRPAGGVRGRLQRGPRRRARDQRAPVAVPDRAQPLAQPPAPREPRSGWTRWTSTSPKAASRPARRSCAARASASCIGDVQQLPETQRTALLLREIDALSYEQIADAMETTVPSVKSLLVRARISLAEAAEARKLSCEEVRLELGEVAEGLVKLSAAGSPPRARLRALPLLPQAAEGQQPRARRDPPGRRRCCMLKKLVLTKLGSTAGAGGGHVAGAGAGAGAAAGCQRERRRRGGASAGGGVLTAGAGALATKAVAGLAAAAIVTAGAVAADHAEPRPPPPSSRSPVAATARLGLRPRSRTGRRPLERAAGDSLPTRRLGVAAPAHRRRQLGESDRRRSSIPPPPLPPTRRPQRASSAAVALKPATPRPAAAAGHRGDDREHPPPSARHTGPTHRSDRNHHDEHHARSDPAACTTTTHRHDDGSAGTKRRRPRRKASGAAGATPPGDDARL